LLFQIYNPHYWVISASFGVISLNMNSVSNSLRNCVLLLTSTKSEYTFLMSATSTSADFLFWATRLDVVIKWIEYLREHSFPILVRSFIAPSVISTSSSWHLISRIWLISLSLYGTVVTIRDLSKRSIGRPWGDLYYVPLILVTPLLVAITKIGAWSLSKALLRKE